MPSRTVRASRVAVAISVSVATALSVPAATAAQFDAFIKFPPAAGADTGEIEIQSYSWGATQLGSGHSGGMGAGKVSMQDMSVTSGPRQTTAMDGTRVAAGDLDGDGADDAAARTVPSPRDAASGMASGKRTHPALMKIEKPLEKGSLILRMALPGCTVGTQYPSAEVGTPDGRYELTDVVVAACDEQVTLNYAKVKVRGWNPETKEE